ncbi:uncharacterized protein LOC105208056 [Solenopsis invicta]|uniref:uncharacterized protein LOC105208056 n=1 Tax=Solenopsis invicta TaxID=13686 RepID=UPI00193EBB33|nr:uncharacterized protein LOC105208056 [Solenopsis invicta]
MQGNPEARVYKLWFSNPPQYKSSPEIQFRQTHNVAVKSPMRQQIAPTIRGDTNSTLAELQAMGFNWVFGVLLHFSNEEQPKQSGPTKHDISYVLGDYKSAAVRLRTTEGQVSTRTCISLKFHHLVFANPLS